VHRSRSDSSEEKNSSLPASKALYQCRRSPPSLEPDTEDPHGLSERDFDGLFTKDKSVIFNFHGYPWLIHRLAYRRTNHHNFHVRGYKEKGNINTPLELAILNQTDRFSLAIGRDRSCAEAAIFRGARKGKIPGSGPIPLLAQRIRSRQRKHPRFNRTRDALIMKSISQHNNAPLIGPDGYNSLVELAPDLRWSRNHGTDVIWKNSIPFSGI